MKHLVAAPLVLVLATAVFACTSQATEPVPAGPAGDGDASTAPSDATPSDDDAAAPGSGDAASDDADASAPAGSIAVAAQGGTCGTTLELTGDVGGLAFTTSAGKLSVAVVSDKVSYGKLAQQARTGDFSSSIVVEKLDLGSYDYVGVAVGGPGSASQVFANFKRDLAGFIYADASSSAFDCSGGTSIDSPKLPVTVRLDRAGTMGTVRIRDAAGKEATLTCALWKNATDAAVTSVFAGSGGQAKGLEATLDDWNTVGDAACHDDFSTKTF